MMLTYKFMEMYPGRELPLAIRGKNHHDTDTPLHCHDYLELVVIVSGWGRQVFEGPGSCRFEHSVMRGDVFTILPGEKHAYLDCRNLLLYNLLILPGILERDLNDLREVPDFRIFFEKRPQGEFPQLHLLPGQFAKFEEQLRLLSMAMAGDLSCRQFRVRLALLELLMMLFSDDFSAIRISPTIMDEELGEIVQMLENHPERKVDVASLARKAKMSVSGFAHKFKENVGFSPLNYCIYLRLDQARRRLLLSGDAISGIASKCGFYDSNYFTRLFRERYGVTPARYRRSARIPL